MAHTVLPVGVMGQTDEETVRSALRPISTLSDRDICDSYLYLLGRLLVLRHEQRDLRDRGFKWNTVVHHKIGGVGRANPDLDVAYSEGWLAVDEGSATVIDVPKIVGRYYTIQLLNLWGETLANINERSYPVHPAGAFAICMRGSQVLLPPNCERIELPGRKARMIARVELGADPQHAIALQHRITMRTTGAPRIAPPMTIPIMSDGRLPGVEAFDTAFAVLATDRDINPGVGPLQSKLRAVAAASFNSTQRGRIDAVIRQQAWPELERAIAALVVSRNGWVRTKVSGTYGYDWLGRTAANRSGIWSNNKTEMIYFRAGTASPLAGNTAYSMTFAANDLPSQHVKYFWSVVCVDTAGSRVIPNQTNRFFLSSQSPFLLGADGSLTLHFAPRCPAGAPESNWLPTPPDQNYFLTWRSFGPDAATIAGSWFPPSLTRVVTE